MDKNLIIIVVIVIIVIICILLLMKYDYATKNYPVLISKPVYLNAQCLDSGGCSNFSAYSKKIKENPKPFGYGFSMSMFLYIDGRNSTNSSSVFNIKDNTFVRDKNTGLLSKTYGEDFSDISRNIIQFTDEFGIKYLEKESKLIFRFYYRNLDNSNYGELKIANVTLQKWHHIVLVIDNRDVYIYYDNNLQLVHTLSYLPEIDVNDIKLSECDTKLESLECENNVLTCTVADKTAKKVTRCANSLDGKLSVLQYFNDSLDAKRVNTIYKKYIHNPTAGYLWWL